MRKINEKVLIFLVDGFEEIEAMTPIDLLRRAEIYVDTVSINENKNITSSRGVTILADKTIDEIDFSEYGMIVLPGGPGTDNYKKSPKLMEKLKEFAVNKKVAAICAAPTILSALGILTGKKAVCFPSLENVIVKDGNIITSKGAGTSIDFALEIISELAGEDKSEKIAKQIIYRI